MSDIFLSYAIEDRDKAGALDTIFGMQHWVVWPNLFHHPNYLSKNTEKELEAAKVVVVLWSKRARASVVVRESLKRAGLDRLVLVLLQRVDLFGERVELPPESTPSSTIDFSDWDGETEGPAWNLGVAKLLHRIRAIISASSPMAAPPVSLENLSPSEIQESARRGIHESMTSQPEGVTRFRGVFISYRRSEAAAYAGRLYDRLAARFGKERVFIDVENVGWGEDFVEAITAAAESCAVMIVLVGRGWSRDVGGQEEADDYVRLEVATALRRKIPVIPVLLEGASMPTRRDLPEDLAPLVRRNALALSDARWERDVEDLIKSLESLLNK